MSDSKKENSKSLPGPRIIDVNELFGKEKVVILKLGELTYRLMITRQGKLILNK